MILPNTGWNAVEVRSFDELRIWLEGCANEMFTLEELHDIMSANSDGGELYLAKHLKRKLLERYGSLIYFAEICGRRNVLCFRDMCSFLVNGFWYKQKASGNAAEESPHLVSAAAQLIAAEIRELPNNCDSYPTADYIQNNVTRMLPPLLHTFVTRVCEN